MRRRLIGAIAVTTMTASLFLSGVTALAQTAHDFRDEFGSISYAGNDGSDTFSGPWRERGENDGTNAGVVQVVSDMRCAKEKGNCLRIGSDGGSIDGFAADRTADLADAQDASLSFIWRRSATGSPSTEVRLRVSSNGGATWSTIATIALKGAQSSQSSTFDISRFSSPNTTIRFEGVGSGANAWIHIDDVTIDATFIPPTTTTAPPTTTTVPVPGPGPTTTTTTVPSGPPITTTTVPDWPPVTTTTTAPGATTTTTVAVGSTSTTVPGAGVDVPTTTSTPPTAPSPGDNAAPLTPPMDGDAPPAADSPDEPSQSDSSTSPNGGGDSATSASAQSDEALADESSDSGPSSPVPIAAIVTVQLIVLGSVVGAVSLLGIEGRSKP